MEKDRNISIYADTSMEWQMTAQACFARGYPVATAYASLGEEALQYSLEQTEVTHVITDAALMPTIAKVSEFAREVVVSCAVSGARMRFGKDYRCLRLCPCCRRVYLMCVQRISCTPQVQLEGSVK